ncbi:MAG: proline dehydrogenase family protein, partial [Deltaproteobacteria bacterium]|nr:proline dehydrogenase family protein [Deltaproteobacteria bacterium]
MILREYFSASDKITIFLLSKLSHTLFFREHVLKTKIGIKFMEAFYTLQFFSVKAGLNNLLQCSPCVIDILGEYSKNPEAALNYLEKNFELCSLLPEAGKVDLHLALKPSAFCWHNEKQILKKLFEIVEIASEKKIPTVFDAEDRETNCKFTPVLKQLIKSRLLVGLAVQAYWHDTVSFLEDIFALPCEKIWIRVVKGAYFLRELAKNSDRLISCPRQVTDNFFKIIDRFSQTKRCFLAVGTHNLSLLQQLLREDAKVEYQF